MNPLEQAAFDCIYDQFAGLKITFNNHYTVDLAEDIIKDSRIATTALDLRKYRSAIGPVAWTELLRAHAHASDNAHP